MIIHSIHDNNPSPAFNLLKSEFVKITDDKLQENYNPRYAAIPGNFFYDLRNGTYKKGRGNYYVIEVNSEYVCSAGWHRYTDNIALLLTRTYVNSKFSALGYPGTYILPELIKEASNYNKMWITCNEHNKTIYNMLTRLSKSKPGSPSQWPEAYKKFKPIGKHKVLHVDQWVGEYDTTL